MSIQKLESSIPANNEKIIELYQKVTGGQINTSPDFQRKLVWKRQHKYNFINTILMNYPFPEIYKAPGSLNVESLQLTDLIVDGQQRVTTIVNFIDGKDVFSLESSPVKFSDLNKQQKEDFLNYEVSVRYLKNATKAQIKEIFQRINNTEYSLNRMERLNAQWGDSEFVCFGKQLIEEELAVDQSLLTYIVDADGRKLYLEFFHGKNIFTENDNNRMLSLQYILTLIATIVKGDYFRRNDESQQYIELYNDEFDIASDVDSQLRLIIKLIESWDLDSSSYWYNKANIFTLITELYKYDVARIDAANLKELLVQLEGKYKDYMNSNQAGLDPGEIKYFDYSREAVNEKYARDHRGTIIRSYIETSLCAE